VKHAEGRLAVTKTITADVVQAYCLCPRKAFLLMTGAIMNPGPHDYEMVIREQAYASRQAYRARLAEAGEIVTFGGPEDLATSREVLADAELTAAGFHARCDYLAKANEPSRLGKHSYEPVVVVGNCRASKTDMIGLAYRGIVLGEVQGRLPKSGTLVRLGDRPNKVKLAGKYKAAKKIVEVLKGWVQQPSIDAPPVVLNKHCPSCPFRDDCLQKAEAEDNLSLLDRMTPKLLRKYHDKGIFTIRQLSHAYKLRRSRKKTKRQIRHSLELQALAIRTGKVYVEHLPKLPRGPVELIVDLEGVPDHDNYYLAGLLVCRGGEAEYEPIWADDAASEAAMWSALVERLEAFPDAPVYHYGSYEKKAFTTLSKRHNKGKDILNRLVNVAASIYGKVYFPVRSNGLKSLGRFLGAAWTDPHASGLQSLVWRHRWEITRDEQCRQSLMQYNHEDCEAVRLLVDRLEQIRRDAASDPTIEFASQPKRYATETGKAVHRQLESILMYAQDGQGRRGLRIRADDTEEPGRPKKRGAPKGHQAFHRVEPIKAGRAVRVPPRRKCPFGHGDLVLDDTNLVDRMVIDLEFTRNGCRKVITRYFGKKSYCPKCGRWHSPRGLDKRFKCAFGHCFQAWVVYQRIILRLPYRIIIQAMEHLFHIGMNPASAINFLGYMADYYSVTETAILQAILTSSFVHVDETKVSIQGVDHYVWVFTDGKHVVFRLTETREPDIVHKVLAGYKGILVSDFYPGYDGVPCRQQKCLVHLIGDINDDLWKAPFDKELEAFAVAVQNLLVPILEAVDRFGLKARHLRKFLKDVDRFYDKNITGREYTSEPVRTYQKRFDRYRGSLFTFLTEDGIPWNNNMAERAIRQLAVQRKISGQFYKRVVPHYLRLLAISQTCRFQEKSFLKFLLSKETDLDSFRRRRPVRYSHPVGRQRGKAEPALAGSETGPAHPEGDRLDQ
jgi:predicted RecB family nuclease